MNEIYERIDRLKRQRDAVILAHYYVPGEVQAAADGIGDSYFLARAARDCAQQTIVFCGVNFMGESAKLLNPGKTVLMPDPAADCPMAHMVDEARIGQYRRQYDDLAVVCYINSTARTKALSDVCVTSANAVKIVQRLPQQHIFFIPDGNLGAYVQRRVPEKHILLNSGYCPRHAFLTPAEVQAQKDAHPDAPVLAHPECGGEVLAMADFIGSTSGIIRYAEQSDAAEFIICTEQGVEYELHRRCPGKKFWFASRLLLCQNMKRNTLEALVDCLENGTGEITLDLDEAQRQRALAPLDRMLELAK
ncbi:MAG: quinolinate synthase NadA [Gemmiger sp.]